MCLLCITNNLPQTTYCERGASVALLAEPINALTNLVYPLMDFFAYKLLKDKRVKAKEFLALPWLLSIVGIGSFLYHTARNPITLIFDALPLFIFILYALFLTLKELFQSKLIALTILLGFVVLEIILSIYVPREFLNGSVRHITAIIFILFLSIFIIRRYGNKTLKPLAYIIGLYASAIVFRSIDLAICPFIPIGTHFLWHVLGAFAGYQAIVLLSVIKSGQSKQFKNL